MSLDIGSVRKQADDALAFLRRMWNAGPASPNSTQLLASQRGEEVGDEQHYIPAFASQGVDDWYQQASAMNGKSPVASIIIVCILVVVAFFLIKWLLPILLWVAGIVVVGLLIGMLYHSTKKNQRSRQFEMHPASATDGYLYA